MNGKYGWGWIGANVIKKNREQTTLSGQVINALKEREGWSEGWSGPKDPLKNIVEKNKKYYILSRNGKKGTSWSVSKKIKDKKIQIVLLEEGEIYKIWISDMNNINWEEKTSGNDYWSLTSNDVDEDIWRFYEANEIREICGVIEEIDKIDE